MILPLHLLSQAPRETVLEAEAAPDSELFEAGARGMVTVQVGLENLAEGGFLARGKATGRLQAECARCLEGFDQGFEVDFNLLGGKKDSMGLEWVDDEDQGVEDYQAWIGPDVVEIPLGHIIAEQLMLNYTLHPLPDLDPSDRCVQCGLPAARFRKSAQVDRVDPRWAGLRSLKENPGHAPKPKGREAPEG